jgi:hypothetical protein
MQEREPGYPADKSMRFLDLDLDFFLNENAYRSVHHTGRLGAEHKPWSVPKVRDFLENRCRLSPEAPLPGRTVEGHDEVLEFWRTLIGSGGLTAPFEVIHVDAHPDLWAGDGLCLSSGFLCIDSGRGLESLSKKEVHSGNYLTFAILYGWVASLVWVPLRVHSKDVPVWDADARSILRQSGKNAQSGAPVRAPAGMTGSRGVPFKIVPWQKFRMDETFDFVALSRSPSFTPLESDNLITVIEEYMQQV